MNRSTTCRAPKAPVWLGNSKCEAASCLMSPRRVLGRPIAVRRCNRFRSFIVHNIDVMKAFSLICLLGVAWLPALGADNPPTVAEAKAFLDAAEAKLLTLSVESQRADWVKNTYITDDTETLAAKADERTIAATVDLVKQSKRFDGLQLPDDLARKLKLLRLSLTVATPSDPKEGGE